MSKHFKKCGHACKMCVDGNETCVKGLGLKAYWLKNDQ